MWQQGNSNRVREFSGHELVVTAIHLNEGVCVYVFYPSVFLSVCLSVCLDVCQCLSVCLDVCLTQCERVHRAWVGGHSYPTQ